jgi:adenylate cyclase
VKAIAQDMNRIQNLEIDESITHHSFFYEITLIADALASMKHGLKAFSKFVPYTLVKQLIISGKGAELGGEKRPITMMFTDIAGFTTISESMSTEQLLLHISEYLDKLTTIILSQQGTVDKYIGDSIMSFWGAPIEDNEQEYHSCKAALLCLVKLKELNAKWVTEGKPELNTRFGINSGEVSVGNMGSSDRMNYTVLGDSVNLASRLEAINKYYGTVIIVGENTYEVVKTQFCFRPIDVVAVKGKTRGVKIYQLLAASSAEPEIAPRQDDLKSQELTVKGFDAYINRNFQLALELYTELIKEFPNDPIGEMYIERCKDYLKTPPPADWDGVTHMKTK